MEDAGYSERFKILEARVSRLEGRAIAEKGVPPMERGMTLFPEGDAIPNKSHNDLLDGKTYIVDGEPLAFVKNTSGKFLVAGESFRVGKVDTKLRSPSVAPNNFFYLEV